jgi:hypothetical protein
MLVVLMVWALAQAPDYDAFCDRDGNMLTLEHGLALMAMLQRSGQVEALYADAAKGNPRAKRVVETLETDYFPDIGRELAEKVSQPPCLVPALRELSGWCVPDWTFLDFLSQDRPGGARLRRAFFDGYAERLRQRGLENQLVLSAANAILGVAVAATVLRQAEAASASRVAANLSREERLAELAKDPAIGGKVTAKTTREAEAALGLEQAGELRTPVKRDPTGGADFIDGAGRAWDVKAFNSRFPPRSGGFELGDALTKIKKALDSGENVILETRDLSPAHLADLKRAVDAQGWSSRIRWWPE